MPQFQSRDGKRFWKIDVSGSLLTTTSGLVGTDGRRSGKQLSSPSRARTAAEKLIREKLAGGYVEQKQESRTAIEPTPSPNSEVVAFEEALRDKPDDATGWLAYADYLTERNDPRGEFIQIQVALEDESRPRAKRKELQERETELLKEYEREWLGELADHLLNPSEDYPIEFRWRRGFVSSVTAHSMNEGQARTLATSPQARFLAELQVYEAENYRPLGSQNLAQLRVFQIGPEVDEERPNDLGTRDRMWYSDAYRSYSNLSGVEQIIAGMTRIEELHLLGKYYDIEQVFALPNLTRLRVLRVYHLGVGRNAAERGRYEYPLEVLARNPAVKNLTHLLFHPHTPEFHMDHVEQLRRPSYLPLDQVRAVLWSKYLQNLTHIQFRLSNMGDEGVREIIASGVLKRLDWLDLRHGCITDEGAKLFAECPDTRNLERLDLTRNGVTAKGLTQLRKAKINAVAKYPLTATELAEEHYLDDGDFE